MEKRPLGSLQVSVVGVGCNNFGSRLDQAATTRVVLAALDAGINFFDTADIYGCLLYTSLTAERTSGPIFSTSTGKPMDRPAVWRTLRRLAREAVPAKAGSLHPHDLRHAFVTLSLDAGASLRDVQDAAGHADPRTTRRYDRARHNLDKHPTYALAGIV